VVLSFGTILFCRRFLSVELDQVLGVDLVAVEHHVDLGAAHVVHAAVVEVREAGVLGGRAAVHGVPGGVLAHQHAGQEHGAVRRLAGEHGRRRQAVPLQCVAVLARRQAELAGVLGVPGEVAPWRGGQWAGPTHCGGGGQGAGPTGGGGFVRHRHIKTHGKITMKTKTHEMPHISALIPALIMRASERL